MFETVLPFILTSLAIELTPGPNMGYLAVLGLERGRKAGLAAVAGVAAGLLLLGLLAGTGLGSIVSETRWLYELVRWAGVAFLLWLAWDGYRESRLPLERKLVPRQAWNYFVRGFVTNLLNPKAAVFYIAVLPNFLPETHPGIASFLLLTLVYVAVATAVHAAIALASGTFQPLLASDVLRRRMGVVFALLLVAIAAWVALTTAKF